MREILGEGSLAEHCQTQYDVAEVVPGQEVEVEGKGDEPRTYRIRFLT